MVICYSSPNWRDRDKTFKSEKWGIFNFMSGNQTEEKKFYLIYFNIAWNCIVHIAFPCFWIVVLEKTLESPLDCKEIKPVNPKGNLSWIFIGRTDAEAEAPNTLATWCEELTHQKTDHLMLGRTEGRMRRGNGEWDSWMASPTLGTWV